MFCDVRLKRLVNIRGAHYVVTAANYLLLSATASIVVVLALAPAVSAAAASARFLASPTSGRAPFTVKFCASAGIAIDFGDGASSGMGIAPAGACPADAPMYVTHVYGAPGKYRLHGSPCPVPDRACGVVAERANAVTIIVRGRR